MKCPRCQKGNPSDAKFCLECGVPFNRLNESGSPGASYAELQRALSEALEQQTATSEILRVISDSRTDVKPVFDSILQSATRLCGGFFSALCRFDGERVMVVAEYHLTPEASTLLRAMYPAMAQRRDPVGRALLERRVVHVVDGASDPVLAATRFQQAVNYRSVVFVPMLREHVPVGVIVIGRDEVRRFSDREIELVKTFADQVVIDLARI